MGFPAPFPHLLTLNFHLDRMNITLEWSLFALLSMLVSLRRTKISLMFPP